MSLNILVVGPSWVGDMVMAQSLFIQLKQRYPDCSIDVLAPQWSLALLERMPEVANGVAMPVGHGKFGWGERRKISHQLKLQGYDQAIVLPNSWKSALIPWFAKIPVRIGYKGEMRWGLLNDIRRLDKQKLPKTVQRFVALGHPTESPLPLDCPVPKLVIAPENLESVRQKFSLQESHDKILGLCPGAEYGEAKRWPAEYYAEVANHWLANGGTVWLFGSEKDQQVCNSINQKCSNRCQDFSGKTTLAEAVDLMSLTELVVSNDSGLMHVAAALDKKLIAIYGSSDPGFTPPLNINSKVIRLGLDCSPCFKRECPYGHYQCLRDIPPKQVIEETLTL